MDRGSSLFSLCVLLYCVFLTARFSNGGKYKILDADSTQPGAAWMINLSDSRRTGNRKEDLQFGE